MRKLMRIANLRLRKLYSYQTGAHRQKTLATGPYHPANQTHLAYLPTLLPELSLLFPTNPASYPGQQTMSS